MPAATKRGSFKRGFLIGITNPKSAVFFGSLFATILPAHAPDWVYGATIALAAGTAFGWFMAVALAFSLGRVQCLVCQGQACDRYGHGGVVRCWVCGSRAWVEHAALAGAIDRRRLQSCGFGSSEAAGQSSGVCHQIRRRFSPNARALSTFLPM